MIDIVVGLGWGDEGKGATVDALVAAQGIGNTLRFNGGHQAAHNVIADGVHHTFSTFGSGTLAGAASWIGPRCTIDPLAAVNEQRALSRALARVAPRALARTTAGGGGATAAMSSGEMGAASPRL